MRFFYLLKSGIITAIRHTFTKAERLKSRKSIQTLFREGKAFTIAPYKVFYKTAEDPRNLSPVKAGFGVSSRIFPKAVDRNRIKRLGRETWRLQKQDLYLTLKENNRHIHLFFVYTSRGILTYQEISDKMNLIVKKLQKELAG